MTVRIEKPAINVREELADLRKPSGVAGEAMLRAETPQEQFNLIGAGRRNLIINGDMKVWQRGTSFTNLDSYGADRFITDNFGGASVTYDVERSTDAPSGFVYSTKVTVATAETPSGTDASSLLQYRFEGQDVQGLGWGQGSATLSFWIKCSQAGAYPFAFEAIPASGNGETFMAAYTVNSSSTWEYKTITIPLGIASADYPRTDNSMGLIIRFGGGGVSGRQGVAGWQDRTTSFTGMVDTLNLSATANATWQITGLQLEKGSVATPFEHRSYGEELALCQRYYYKFGDNSGYNSFISAGNGAQRVRGSLSLPVTMRAQPSVSLTGSPSFYGYQNATNYSSVAVFNSSTTSISTDFNISPFVNAGDVFDTYFNVAGNFLSIDAEL